VLYQLLDQSQTQLGAAVLPAIRLRDPVELLKDAGQLRLWDLAAVAADKEDPFSFWSYLQADGSLRGGYLTALCSSFARRGPEPWDLP
jgi:hypothetical protein